MKTNWSLYPSLNRMLVKGWLAAEWGTSENNRKARFYRLTAEGRKQLARETEDFDRLVHAIQQVMRTVCKCSGFCTICTSRINVLAAFAAAAHAQTPQRAIDDYLRAMGGAKALSRRSAARTYRR